MYYVYRLDFDGCCYVGCTNNLQRRGHQHNENARKRSSKLGRYLNENKIIISVSDFTVVYSFRDRKDALREERNLAFSLASKGVVLLNDNYSPDCSRKGKNEGHTAKEYVVVDYVNHTAQYVCDLRRFCRINGYRYKELQRTVHRKIHRNQFIAFYKDEWEGIQNKEFFLSGEFVKVRNEKIGQGIIARSAKQYDVMFPDGHIETVYNLDKFAREHNLTSGTLHATFNKKKPTKGYQVIRRI